MNTIDELPKMIVEQKLIAPDGYFILEHTRAMTIPSLQDIVSKEITAPLFLVFLLVYNIQ